MNNEDKAKFVKGLQIALQKERATHRTYLALANSESNEARRKALIGLAETEAGHAERWSARLTELGAEVPPDIARVGIGGAAAGSVRQSTEQMTGWALCSASFPV